MTDKLQMIDSHFHIFDAKELELPWLELFDGKLKSRYTFEDYKDAHKNYDFGKSVYLEVDVADEANADKEAQIITKLCDQHKDKLFAVLGARLESETFAEYIKKHANHPSVSGVRQNFFCVDEPMELLQAPAFKKNMALLQDLSLSLDVVVIADKLDEMISLAKNHPATKIIINHCGLLTPDNKDEALKQHWQEAVSTLAEYPNVYMKISDFTFLSKNNDWGVDDIAPTVEYCLEVFDEDRVLYGSNWMVCTVNGSLDRWLEALLQIIGKQSGLKQKLFYDNADQLYCSN
jgi:L-fuconolactonase